MYVWGRRGGGGEGLRDERMCMKKELGVWEGEVGVMKIKEGRGGGKLSYGGGGIGVMIQGVG